MRTKKWHKLQILYDFRDYEASWLLETTEKEKRRLRADTLHNVMHTIVIMDYEN